MEKDLLRVIQACVGAVVLLATVLLIFGLFPSMKSEVGAAWVQAIGSIVAILSGIAVVRYQLQEAARVLKTEEAMRVYRLLTSLRTEIEILGEKFITPLGVELAAHNQTQTLPKMLHFVPEQFVVFDSHVAHFGSINSDSLRRLLIAGYASFRGLLFSVEMNTLTFEEYESEMLACDEKMPEKRVLFYRNKMHTGGQEIRVRHAEAARFIDNFRTALADEVLRKHYGISHS
nr:hypothetical protein [Herbaspirillum sp. B39]